MFIAAGLVLLLCAISAVIVIIKPWTVSCILLIVLPFKEKENKKEEKGKKLAST